MSNWKEAANSQTHAVDAGRAKGCATASKAAHLVDALAAVVCMHICVGCTKVPPLKAVHWPEVTLFPAGQQLLHLDKLVSNLAQHDFLCMLAGIGPA